MYTFSDRGDRSLTLRPEGTASVVRAYLQNNLGAEKSLVKLYYIGPMFRYERPQAGRYRQHHQFGVEALGARNPAVDAETIGMAMSLFKGLGLRNLTLYVNSIGCPQCRPDYDKTLGHFLEERAERLCEDCRKRMVKNPLRVLDCKNKKCVEELKSFPKTLDSLCDECGAHHEKFRHYMNLLNTECVEEPRLVRGLDYYTKTTFEIVSGELGAQNTMAGGGRYDGLIETLGGKPTPAFGFGAGLERLLLTLEGQGIEFKAPPEAEVALILLDDRAFDLGMTWLRDLRGRGIGAACDFFGKSMKNQLKQAGRQGARFAVIVGEDEINKGMAAIKNLETREQFDAPFEGLPERVADLAREADRHA